MSVVVFTNQNSIVFQVSSQVVATQFPSSSHSLLTHVPGCPSGTITIGGVHGVAGVDLGLLGALGGTTGGTYFSL